MPFLLDFISEIKHESALTISNEASRPIISIPMPFQGIQTSIMEYSRANSKVGVCRGDAIDLIGISGSGKSYIMKEIARHTLEQSQTSHVLYIDLDGRFEENSITNARFHLFKPMHIHNIVYHIEDWLINHASMYVLWIMVDGLAIGEKQISLLRKIQQKWSFVLLTTNTLPNEVATKQTFTTWNYRFLVDSTNNKLQMIWPMHMSAFSI